jgi:putative hydrolases of HD superfamily
MSRPKGLSRMKNKTNSNTAKNNPSVPAENAKENTADDNLNIVRFFFELGQLKRVKRSGWWLINIKDPETVAEHSFRAAMVGYTLAKIENADADKVMKMCLLQDLCEARLNDLHKLGQRYIQFKKHEKEAFEEQILRLPKEMQKEFLQLFSEYHNDSSREGIIARDADLLECALQAKEYIDSGYKDAQGWNDNIRKILRTTNARKMFELIEKTGSNSWWKGLKNSTR